MAQTYVALLRGINVGGNNIIRMADLKHCFESDLGFEDVATLIQSGNVIFCAGRGSVPALTSAIEAGLSKRFGYRAAAVVLSRDAMTEVVTSAPKGFGSVLDKFRYDVIFLKPPLTARDALRSISAQDGVDAVYRGKRAIYFSRLISKASQSRLSKIASSPIHPLITIRDWNTTTKLLALMNRAG